MNKKIKTIVEKYMGEIDEGDIKKVPEKEAVKKLIKAINSINSEKHVDAVVKMIHNYLNLYPMSFWDHFKSEAIAFGFDPRVEKWLEKLEYKLEKLEQEGKIKKGFAKGYWRPRNKKAIR